MGPKVGERYLICVHPVSHGPWRFFKCEPPLEAMRVDSGVRSRFHWLIQCAACFDAAPGDFKTVARDGIWSAKDRDNGLYAHMVGAPLKTKKLKKPRFKN